MRSRQTSLTIVWRIDTFDFDKYLFTKTHWSIFIGTRLAITLTIHAAACGVGCSHFLAWNHLCPYSEIIVSRSCGHILRTETHSNYRESVNIVVCPHGFQWNDVDFVLRHSVSVCLPHCLTVSHCLPLSHSTSKLCCVTQSRHCQHERWIASEITGINGDHCAHWRSLRYAFLKWGKHVVEETSLLLTDTCWI